MIDPKAVAIVGMGAILPDAEGVTSFWENIRSGRYSIEDVPENRWRVDHYYDPDPSVPDKTYTKIGGWVKSFQFEPLKWGIPIPPSVLAVMDDSQKWGIAAARQALMDYGYPQKALDPNRVAVIIGNALAGENHYITSLRIHLPRFAEALSGVEAFHSLPKDIQQALLDGMAQNIRSGIANITEDTMPGELGNIIAGRIANVFNFGGPNFVTDAACAASLAALQSAVDGLVNYQYDAVITGGVDRNMGVEGFVKFCKIGALSPDGSRPFAEGANGFVMGEGAALFLLKRLADAEKDGDKIYAVIRGIGASSDGKGKGITAPNPIGQQRALERAWKNAGVNPASVGLIEAHGTSTRVGDVVEVNSLNALFGQFGLQPRSIALGSVKSNIGHLKSAAGAAGILKTTLALHHKVLPPSVNFHKPNPNIEFDKLPFFVNTEARPWDRFPGEVRRAGVSSFGFGGTNFHLVMEEWVPGLLTSEKKTFPAVKLDEVSPEGTPEPAAAREMPKPYRGLLFVGAADKSTLKERLNSILEAARALKTVPDSFPAADEVAQPERIVIDYAGLDEFINRAEKALKTLDSEAPNAWQALTAQGVYRGSGKPGKVAFLFPGQGSQYVNMLKDLCEVEPVVADTFKEADAIMEPILGRPLTSYIYVDGDEESLKTAEAALRDTAITQPAMLTANVALLRLMNKFGYQPDMVIGHSLGEYAALVASGVLTFAEALEVVSARGREMKKVSVADNGGMVAVSAPIEEVARIIQGLEEYIVIANINSPVQSVVGGSTAGIEAALKAFQEAGFQATRIPVSHAFHTKIVAPASAPLKEVIARMSLKPPQIPVVANVTGELYPTKREEMLEILGQQVASPVQFIKGMQTLYASGVRVFAEIGPKRVLNALANDNLKDKTDVTLLATNHPRKGAVVSFNEALCGLLAAGIYPRTSGVPAAAPESSSAQPVIIEPVSVQTADSEPVAALQAQVHTPPAAAPANGRQALTGSVVISGAGLGLPGRNGLVFDENNIDSILKGEIRIESLPTETREKMLQKRVTRLEKSDAGAEMVLIDDLDLTVKLAGQRGRFDLQDEFGVPAERADACDIATQLAIAAGVDALRDAGIPLVMAYRKTSKGTYLPDRWRLPEALADETGVIFGSAFPGLDRMAEEADRYYQYKILERQLQEVQGILTLTPADQQGLRGTLRERVKELESQLKELDYHFDRRYIFRILSMGHSQFAEYIGARGPNTHVNAACATTTHALAVAEDWIRTGRCRRVVVIAGDDVTSGSLSGWVGTGLLASGASTLEGNLRMAALPFDRRRNGMIMGMGAAALVVESEDAVRERGMRAICEVLSTHIANSAFHGTRLDIPHVREVMDRVLKTAEERFGIHRAEIAAQTMFMSHETYTPARGGSASAEINALRYSFGEQANKVIIANTKGFTGHTMGVGVEDVVAVKALEKGIVPPIAHLDDQFEPDPDLGDLNLSRGGEYPLRYALRLGAGFGSQIAMALFRLIPGVQQRVNEPVYRKWAAAIAGYESADLEVEKHTLRVRHVGPPVKAPAKSSWQYGQGPTMWAERIEDTTERQHLPAAKSAEIPAPKAEERVPPVAVPTAGTPAPQPAVQVVDSGFERKAVEDFVLGVVSEKTGYPPEMLDLDLDLEADLGIDTVKQAELFATIRSNYNIPRREDLRLVDYNTLNKVIDFMIEALGGQAVQTVAPMPGTPGPQPVTAAPAAVSAEVVEALLPENGGQAEREAIKAFVLGVVSEKTGYPPEMLDLDLDLEADLGIDTVKQAELFATIRSNYNIPRREDLRLVDYNNLNKVIDFMVEARGGEKPLMPAAVLQVAPAALQAEISASPSEVQAVQGTPVIAGAGEREAIKDFVLSVVSEKTGYPIEMLDLDLDLEADLGIDTVKQAELFATIRSNYNIPRREDLRLVDYNTLNKVIDFMMEAQGAEKAAMPAAVLQPAPAALQAEISASPSEVQAVQGTPVIAGAGEREAIQGFVLGVVSEKTGYPVEMLDLDLDLEADLGIDTVKQAELFATIRTNYNIPRREDLRLVDYNTLNKVIDFMIEAQPDLQAEQPAQPLVEPGIHQTAPTSEVQAAASDKAEPIEIATAASVEESQPSPHSRIRRRVPVAVLRPRLDLCVDTGIRLEEGVRVVVVGGGKAGDSLARRLRARKVQVLAVETAPLETMVEKVRAWQADGAIHGVYYLAASDAQKSLDEMSPADWQAAIEGQVMPLYHLLREVHGDPFLVSATRLGGTHGFGPHKVAAPLGGAITGFTKAMALERADTFAKAVDFPADETPAQMAARLIEETLRDPGVVEVGWEGRQRYGVGLVERLVSEEVFELSSQPVYLVSGGSGGIISPVVSDLARKTHGTFYLLGRTALPEEQDEDIQRVRSDREGLKKDLLSRLEKATPAMIEKELARLEKAASVHAALQAVNEAGGQAQYIACDVADVKAVQDVVRDVLKRHKRVDVVIHAAGVERSRKLPLKPEDEFRATLASKASGFFNLYHALKTKKALPKAVVIFGSVAGRFGNSGQTDYAAANDLNNKLAAAMRSLHPDMKVVAIDWSAWAEVGMASRGYIPRLMEMGGIDMMPPTEAAPLVYEELSHGSESLEVVLGGSLGMLERPRHPSGGLDLEAANRALTEGEPIHVMLSRAAGLTLNDGILLEAELNPNEEPFLKDHALNGIPLLPGVMGIEGFSVAAKHVSSVLGSEKGGFDVAGLEDIRFLAPFKFYRAEPRRITWKAQVVREKSGLVAYVTLESTLALKTRKNEVVQHFAGIVHLKPVSDRAEELIVTPPEWDGAYTVSAAEIYRLYFHGPAFQVLDGVQRSGDVVLGRLAQNLPPITDQDQKLVTLPLLLELCLQTAGVWEVGATGTLALPSSIGELNLYRIRPNGQPIYAEVRPGKDASGRLCFDARVVDANGHVYLNLLDYRTTPLPYGVEEDLVKPLRALVQNGGSD